MVNLYQGQRHAGMTMLIIVRCISCINCCHHYCLVVTRAAAATDYHEPFISHFSLTCPVITRSSTVAKRPRDASCLYSFYALEWCGYPMANKFEHMFIRFDMIHEREKNRRFHVPQPTFLFPVETPLRLSRNMLHGWKDTSMLA